MNLAEKILNKQPATMADCYAFAYEDALEAMREIAWEAWKEVIRDVYGDYVSTSDDDEKKFNEWYNKQIS